MVNDRKISYQGKETSLSALAAHLTGRSSVAGPLFFTYKGKVLADIRNKKEGHVGARGKGRSLKPVKPSAVMVIEETPPEKKVKKPRLTPFRFGACGIAPGSEIAFIRDPAVVATVVDDRSIRYRGELTSLSALACKLTGRTAAQGPIFFTYKGKVLSDIRRQKEGRREEDTGEKAAQPEVAQVDKQPMKTQEVQTEKERKRAPFRFSACGIAPGSEIAYIRDPEVVATVVDYRNIRYRGELTSLSALACKLTGRTSAAGPLFFTYKGKVLADIRLEIEGEEA